MSESSIHSKTALEILKCGLTVCIQSIRSLKKSYRTFGYNLVRDNSEPLSQTLIWKKRMARTLIELACYRMRIRNLEVIMASVLYILL